MDTIKMIITVLSSAGVFTCIVSILLKRFENRIDEKEKANITKDILLIECTQASISLGEAMASELKNTGKTNGETEKALAYATDAKHKIKDFLTEQAMKNIA